MNTALIRLTCLLLALQALAAHAAPAAWFWWEGASTRDRVCAQVSPGPGWTRVAGPYNNARCQR